MAEAQSRYKALGLKATGFRSGECLLHSQLSGKKDIIQDSTRELLFDCTEFRSLEEHARRRVRDLRHRLMDGAPSSLRLRVVASLLRFVQSNDIELPLRDDEVTPVRKKLEGLVVHDWLMSEGEVRAEIDRRSRGVLHTSVSEEDSVSVIGVTTTERRTATLRASLESYAQNFVQFGRTPDIVVMDDTPRSSGSEEVRGVLSELSSRYPGAVYYGSREMRKRAAHSIAQRANIPERTARFALLGDRRCPITTGSARNALLAVSTGELSLHVDDDTFCRLRQAPEYREGIQLSSQKVVSHFRFGPSENGESVEKDLLSIHEALLGRDPRLCIQEASALDVEDVGWHFLDAMNGGEQRVGYTLMGSRGDSGWRLDSNFHRILPENQRAFRHLTEDPHAYRKRLNTRSVLRTTPQYTIETGPFCMAMQIGLDQRSLLPPFMPVQRNQDGIFGVLAKICGPELYSGHLPFTIAHIPPGERQRETEVNGSAIDPDFLQPRAPDLLLFCIAEHNQFLLSTDRGRSLKQLGEILKDLAALGRDAFVSYFESLFEVRLAERIQWARRKLKIEQNAIEEWRGDVERYIHSCKQLLRGERRVVLSDLPGTSGERWILFREIVGQFGDLLIHWPSLLRAVEKQNGRRRFIVEEVR